VITLTELRARALGELGRAEYGHRALDEADLTGLGRYRPPLQTKCAQQVHRPSFLAGRAWAQGAELVEGA
jgi:hypothetical protein